ncbi:MAG: TIR domain-containing protein [Nanoarchaeota archaeon]|nr:TIR domain-containing protein [Nanoarchaeota archaeon]
MPKSVFFSFDYDRDIWRVSQVRNSNVVKPRGEEDGFIDSASWEEVKKKDEATIKRWIDNQLEGTSITIVLIGAQTYDSKWVNYEIQTSANRKNKLLGIYIHNIRNNYQQTDYKGKNPFEKFTFTKSDGTKINLSNLVPVYDWVLQDGRSNITKWIDTAFKLN